MDRETEAQGDHTHRARLLESQVSDSEGSAQALSKTPGCFSTGLGHGSRVGGQMVALCPSLP